MLETEVWRVARQWVAPNGAIVSKPADAAQRPW